jgi:hypothetical protein
MQRDDSVTSEFFQDDGGSAWTVPIEPGNRCVLALWLIDAPWAHPIWSQYCLSLIHLRDAEGFRPARKHDDRATHEVMLCAIDPKTRVNIGMNDPHEVMAPPNFVGQFHRSNDTEAVDLVRKAVLQVIKRHLSPDTDNRVMWAGIFPFLPDPLS